MLSACMFMFSNSVALRTERNCSVPAVEEAIALVIRLWRRSFAAYLFAPKLGKANWFGAVSKWPHTIDHAAITYMQVIEESVFTIAIKS